MVAEGYAELASSPDGGCLAQVRLRMADAAGTTLPRLTQFGEGDHLTDDGRRLEYDAALAAVSRIDNLLGDGGLATLLEAIRRDGFRVGLAEVLGMEEHSVDALIQRHSSMAPLGSCK